MTKAELIERLRQAEITLEMIGKIAREIDAPAILYALSVHESQDYRREVNSYLECWGEDPAACGEAMAAFEAGTAAMDAAEAIMLDRQ